MSNKIALIDGYGFVFRAYHSLPPLTRSDGVPVGAVYGFTGMLIRLLAGLHVTHAAVVFDSGSKTFRNEIYPAYKANRPPCPEDLKPQFAIMRHSAEALNLCILEKSGFEADDIIATITKKSVAAGYEVLIVSSDKDLMQLVSEKVFMYDAMKNRFIGIEQVKEKFLVEPKKVLDVLALIGDVSDNIPGVKGIGPKTAAELMQQFENLENIFNHIDEIKREKLRQLLLAGLEKAKISKILATLKDDVETGITLKDLEIKSLNPRKLIAFLEEQGFRSLITRVKKEFGIADEVQPGARQKAAELKTDISFAQIKKTRISSPEIIDQLNKEAVLNGIVTIDYANDFLTISTCKNNAVPQEIFYLEVSTAAQPAIKKQQFDLFGAGNQVQQQKADKQQFGLEILTKILRDNSVKKIFFDAKAFLKLPDILDTDNKSSGANYSFSLNSSNSSENYSDPASVKSKEFPYVASIYKIGFGAKQGVAHATMPYPEKIKVKEFVYEDVLLISHLINSSVKNDLCELITLNLNENIKEPGFDKIFAEIRKNKEPEIFSDTTKKADFFCFKNFAIYQLYKIFAPKISELKLNEAYICYEKPLLPVLAQMEISGIKIDSILLHRLSIEFGNRIKELSAEIYQLAGSEFNIASAKQLAEILFVKLHLNSAKKSKKTGMLSTGFKVLEQLNIDGHLIAAKILEFRKFSKLKNTYTDALLKEINPQSGRIHTHFSTTSTITGRLSSSNPNLQNIPVKSPEGQKIRSSFIAKKDHLLISADYSQIELRVIAHIAKIENLITAFKAKKDIHKITAAQIFQVPQDKVEDSLRSKAKAINFGIIYGISAFGLARQLSISKQEAGAYIKFYLETYPGIDSYMKNQIALAEKNGYVQTLSGRKCFIGNINSKNRIIRLEAQRLAINAPIQGSAADIIKKAMISLSKKFSEAGLCSKIILQIHDELLIEAPQKEAEYAAKILEKEMENAVILDLPLKVDIKIAQRWN
jgi:DNA polymerase-1